MSEVKQSIVKTVDGQEIVSHKHILALIQALSAGAAISLKAATTMLSALAPHELGEGALRAIHPESLDRLSRVKRKPSHERPMTIVSVVDGREVVSRKHVMILADSLSKGVPVTVQAASTVLSAVAGVEIDEDDVRLIELKLLDRVCRTQRLYMAAINGKTQSDRDIARDELKQQLRMGR